MTLGRLHRLAGLYDNPTPESTIFFQSGTKNLASESGYKFYLDPDSNPNRNLPQGQIPIQKVTVVLDPHHRRTVFRVVRLHLISIGFTL